MNGLNTWIIELCVCAVSIAIAENLLPEGNVKKAAYFVMGLVVVTCFMSPIESFESMNLDLKSENEIVSENADWLNRTTEEMFSESVSRLVADCLSKINVKPKNIEVHADINEDNCIFIDKVRITVSSECSERLDEIVDEIYRTLGIDADVIVR